MIIQTLCDYYETLLADPESGVSPPGYCKAKVSHAVVLSEAGEMVNLLDLRITRGKKLVSREMDVPDQIKRTVGISANFLCDNCSYVFGFDTKGKPERAKEQFKAFRDYQQKILGDINDAGAQALLHFLNTWNPDEGQAHPLIRDSWDELAAGGNIVFMMSADMSYLQARPAIRNAWSIFHGAADSDNIGQCLVTGERTSLARLHPSIKGVVGAQSSGASLVSFNLDAFTSYGKQQSFNAPVGEKAAFAYTTALNYLLTSDRHRVRIGDATIVFWAERSGLGEEEDCFTELFDPTWDSGKVVKADNNDKPKRDPKTTMLVRNILWRLREGKAVRDVMTTIDPDSRFYILGLSPNASRLSVRFWHMDTFGALMEKVGQHYIDTAINKQWNTEPDFIPLWQILKETAPLGDMNNVSPLLAGSLARAILLGQPYPHSLYTAILGRIRADQTVNYVRAAIIKGCLIRLYKNSNREVIKPMSLDEENANVPYRLGRLFSLLEKAQQDANPGINATIRDRYFGAASAAPRTVFPQLIRLSQHHIAKAEYGNAIDKKIETVMDGIDQFPSYLNLEEQGLFVLGYYHQRNALYKKAK